MNETTNNVEKMKEDYQNLKIQQKAFQEKTIGQKSKEPAINPRQLVVYIMMQIIGISQGLMPLFIGEPFNPIWFLVSIIIDNIAYLSIMTLRSVRPELVVDTNLGSIFQSFAKSMINIVMRKDDAKDYDALMGMLENIMTWSVREWDALYQEQLKDVIEYYKKKVKKQE